jgi:hypothetical protein
MKERRVSTLEGVELFVDTLRNVVVHCLDAGRDRREEDSARRRGVGVS